MFVQHGDRREIVVERPTIDHTSVRWLCLVCPMCFSSDEPACGSCMPHWHRPRRRTSRRSRELRARVNGAVAFVVCTERNWSRN